LFGVILVFVNEFRPELGAYLLFGVIIDLRDISGEVADFWSFAILIYESMFVGNGMIQKRGVSHKGLQRWGKE